MNQKTFIFIGRSGSGKGTQADMIIQYLRGGASPHQTLHVETGAFLREFVSKDTSYTAGLTKEVINAGGLIPEAIAVAMWTEYLFKNYTGKENIVFDGCPRKLHETLLLDSVIQFYKLKKPVVVYLKVSEAWSRDRLSARGRKDDTAESVTKRMKWFDEEVMPSVTYFQNNKSYSFVEINGEQTPEQVHAEILAKSGLAY